MIEQKTQTGKGGWEPVPKAKVEVRKAARVPIPSDTLVQGTQLHHNLAPMREIDRHRLRGPQGRRPQRPETSWQQKQGREKVWSLDWATVPAQWKWQLSPGQLKLAKDEYTWPALCMLSLCL